MQDCLKYLLRTESRLHLLTTDWRKNQCFPQPELISFNYESALAGAETSKESYKCPKGVAVEMWTIAGGHQVPKLNSTFVSALFDFLLAHKK